MVLSRHALETRRVASVFLSGNAMLKDSAVESLGESGLLLPAWVKTALAANDRLKLYFSVVQAAVQHAGRPSHDVIDLSREKAAAGLKEQWMDEIVVDATRSGDVYFLPELPRLARAIATDLSLMARPVLQSAGAEALKVRLEGWLAWLAAIREESLSPEVLKQLVHGNRDHGDSVHILVMDLHKQLNQIAVKLASEVIDGAHVWNLAADDRGRVSAFMRGLNRTAPLKFDHPGLDTAATRDGKRLVLQNDIGTNDAHVLVVQVEDLKISLSYSDLHRTRFEFFRMLLAELGATWSVVEPRVTPGLNAGDAYYVGTASFACKDQAALDNALEGLASRIVFLIDWNRARKRLQRFVSKLHAIDVLVAVARLEVGHMGWLRAGGASLLFATMQTAADGVFRLGDRLDDVLGEAGAHAFLVESMSLASRALLAGQPVALIEDETRVLLTRHLQSRASEFDMAAEHASYCHELAQGLRNALTHGGGKGAAKKLSLSAKSWERRADEIVGQARALAERHPRWRHFSHLIVTADDVADAMEEASFLMGLILEEHEEALEHGVQKVLVQLAESVLLATQDYVRSLAVARSLGHTPDLEDSNSFLDATWRVVLAEKRCDEQLRSARRLILKTLAKKPAELMLANDLAASLEQASDCLLVASYALRDIVLSKAGAIA